MTKNKVIILFAILSVFVAPFWVHAATLYSSGSSFANGNSFTTMGTIFGGITQTSTQNVNGFGLKIFNIGNNTTGTYTYKFGYTSTATSSLNANGITWLYSNSGTISGLPGGTFTSWGAVSYSTFLAPTNYQIPYGKNIVISFHVDNSSTISINKGFGGANPIQCSPDCGSDSVGIELYGLAQNGSVILLNPSSGSTVNDFSSWQSYATGLNVTEPYRVDVQYSPDNTSTFQYTDAGQYISVVDTVNTFQTLKGQSLVPFSALNTTTVSWYARPLLYTSSSIVIGPTIQFTVQRSSGFITPPDWNASSVIAYASDTLWGANIDCSNDTTFGSGTIAHIFCYVNKFGTGFMAWLFKPPEGVTDYAVSILQSFENVAPFNFTIGAVNLLQGQTSQNTPSNLSLTMALPIQNHSSSITLLSSSLLTNAVGSTFKTWWDNIILMLLIVMFVVVIYKMVL